MTAKRPPRYSHKSDRLITPGATGLQIRCDMAAAPLDRVAREMDAKWGVDRLVTLVSPVTAERYGRAMAAMMAAYDADEPDTVAAHATNCIKGLTVMDAEATAAGHKPADPRVWQINIDGKRYGLVEDAAYLAIAERQNPGVEIITLRQAVVGRFPERFGLVGNVIAAFPGATVAAIRPRSQLAEELDDDLPF